MSRCATYVQGGGIRARTLRVKLLCLAEPGLFRIEGRSWGTGVHVSVVDLSCHGHWRAGWGGIG